MDFITIDFETATEKRDSPCEIGLTFVREGQITETKSWLIKPRGNRFNPFNISIHGITPEHTADKPEFNELWNEIKPLIDNQFLIAHNASFDMSVLRNTLTAYQTAFPSFRYACSLIFSRYVWQGLPSYGLDTLCRIHRIHRSESHRAGDDSRVTAELCLKAFAKSGVLGFDDFPEKLNVNIGQVDAGGYQPATKNRSIPKTTTTTNINIEQIDDSASTTKKRNATKSARPPLTDCAYPDNLFACRTVVFTGTLSSMKRAQAEKLIVEIGGIVGKGVNYQTDFLVVGQQDYRVVGDDGMSNKARHAVDLVDAGYPIEMLSEQQFLENLPDALRIGS